MVNHGLSTGALFLLVGVLYERRHTREIDAYGGLAGIVPVTTALFLIATLSSIGLPGLNGFVGEFLILLGTWTSPHRWWAVVAATGVILSAIYMLTLVQRVFWNPLTHEENRELPEIRPSRARGGGRARRLHGLDRRAAERPAVAPRADGRGDPCATKSSQKTAAAAAGARRRRRGGAAAPIRPERAVIAFGPAELAAVAPEIVLAAAGALIVLLEAFAPRTARAGSPTLSLAGVAAVRCTSLLAAPLGATFGGRLETSSLTHARRPLRRRRGRGRHPHRAAVSRARAGEERGEFYALLLWGHLGVSLMVRGLDLLVVFIGLETLSLCFYVLAAFFRGVPRVLRGGPEVLPDRRLRLRVHALRHRSPLRKERQPADLGALAGRARVAIRS